MNILLNFYTIGSLIPTAFTMLGMVFIFTIPNRSKASSSLGWMMTSLTFFHIGYVLASSIYSPLGSYHRWFTGISILFAVVFITRFFFYFLEERALKAGKWIYYSMFTVGVIHGIYFLISSLNAVQFFSFESHYWDFNMQQASKVVAYFIMIFVLIMILTGIWKTIVLKGRNRRVMIITLLSFFISTVPPGILNTMSREGLIAHSVYINAYDILVVIALFSVIILFINNTKDRTSFMAKIIGISMVAFLLLMQVVNYMFMIEKENFYDQNKISQTARLIKNGYQSKDLLYLNRLNLSEKRIEDVILKSNSSIDKEHYLNEYLISHYFALFEKSRNMNDIRGILEEAPDYFNGYIYTIESSMKKYHNQPDAKEKIRNDLLSIYRNILYLKNKIRKVSVQKNFISNLKKTLDKYSKEIPQFRKAILEYVEKESQNQNGAILKKNVLSFLTPLRDPLDRHYRKDTTGAVHFISYMYEDPKTNIIYEAGYSYREYRQYIHDTAIKLFWLLLGISLMATVGFPLFYYRTIIFPLNTLLSGVRQVNRGNLEIEIPVMIQDEMGFLSGSFNNMVRSIKNSKRKLQDYADNLEEMVEKRTQELKKRLDEINQLKTQQDGDYFLTSLLLTPLSHNLVKSNSVEVDFILKQKKQFTFRKWSREIGGDLCVAHSIFLRDLPYTVILNADAMGKSMQGAGGILVLGSVFQSIIERTLSIPSEKAKYPEIWLKHAAIELHKIFLSFDGSMLISMVFGLIDDTTGTFYFINAEHPFSVLYRDQRADFIENEMTTHRKIGTTITEGNISIQIFPLKNNDILFLGSDGRDDIILNNNGEINEDETRFLKIIESCGADLPCIQKELTETGRLIDDLSILKILFKEKQNDPHKIKSNQQYLEDFHRIKKSLSAESISDEIYEELQKLLEKWPDDKDLLKTGIRSAIRKKKYHFAIKMLESYTIISPEETDFIFLFSYCLKKTKQLKRAADMGERVRIRKPENISNLINLSEVYLRLKNRKRAKILIEEVLKMDAGNKRAKMILDKLNAGHPKN